MRPDLAKFCPFGKDLRIFSNIFKVDFVFGKVLTPLWHNFYAFYGWQIFIAEIGQILKTNLVTLLELFVSKNHIFVLVCTGESTQTQKDCFSIIKCSASH